MNDDIFIGVVTHKRESMCNALLDSIPNDIYIFCYKDGRQYSYDEGFSSKFKNGCYVEGHTNLGVASAKKTIVDKFLESEKNHLFIIEDDVLVVNPKVFEYYIRFSEESGLLHLNWNDCMPWTKSYLFDIEYDVDLNLIGRVTRDCAGTFQYFNRSIFSEIDIDTNYYNAWEHIDVELQLTMKGYNPPFWNWVTPHMSSEYLKSQCGGESSTLNHDPNHNKIVSKGMEYWMSKWGYHINKIPQTNTRMVVESLKSIKRRYGR